MNLERNSLKKDFMKFIIPSVVAQLVFALYTMVDEFLSQEVYQRLRLQQSILPCLSRLECFLFHYYLQSEIPQLLQLSLGREG